MGRSSALFTKAVTCLLFAWVGDTSLGAGYYNTWGWQAPQNSVSGPPAPTNLSASNGILQWTAAGGSTTGYKIFYKQHSAQQTFPSNCTTSPGALSYASTTAGNVTTYDLGGLTDCISTWMSILVCSYDNASNYSAATGTIYVHLSNACMD
jgi:hypothetical protein